MLRPQQWVSLQEAEGLVAQSLTSDAPEGIPHKIQLQNKGIEQHYTPPCNSVQLFVHPFLSLLQF